MTIATLTTEKPTMKTYQLFIARLAFACSLLACAPDVLAQQKSAPQTPAPAAAVKPAAEVESAVPNTGAQQGIKVHGHWVIDVRNPDGSLAQHHEFENSMVDLGFNLTTLLAGTATVGEPVIFLSSGGVNATFCGYQYCYMSEYSNGQFTKLNNSGAGCPTPSACVATLVPTVVTTGTSPNFTYSLKLSAQITASQAGSITSVGTLFWNCATSGSTLSNSAPSSCGSQTNVPANTIVSLPSGGSGLPAAFTGTTITSVGIVAGQIVQVSVTISFS